MKNKIKILLLFIFFGIAVYFIILSNIIMHEEVHKQIFYRYGIESEIKIDYWPIPSGETYGFNRTNCNDSCLTQHAFNDIIHHNLVTIENLIILSLFIFFIWKIIIKNEPNN